MKISLLNGWKMIKTKETNISNDENLKLEKIGYYWTKEQIVEIVNLLKEYQDVFSKDYKDLKGLVQEMGEMTIELLLDVKLVKKRPYKSSHN